MELACINDQVVPLGQLDPVYLDRATFFGDGVYEVVRTYDHKLFALDEHLERFSRSLSAVEIHGVDLDSIRQRIVQVCTQAGFPNAKVYFHITRGSELRNHLPSPDTKPNFFMTVTKLIDNPNPPGIAVTTHPDWRWKRCDIKSLNLLPNVLARLDAEKRGAEEAILVDDQGYITEGTASAFFIINAKEKKLITRPLGNDILPSITRGIIEKITEKSALTFTEQLFTPSDAEAADEAFTAVTTKDIIPVTKFNQKPISNAKPGKHTMNLKALFRKYVMTNI